MSNEKYDLAGSLFDGKWEDEKSDVWPETSTRTSEFEGEEELVTDTSADLEDMYPY